MLIAASQASSRTSRRCRSRRSTETTWVCTVPARWVGRAPGRRRRRAIHPVTAFSTGADTSKLARSDTAGSRGRGDRLWRDDLDPESPRLHLEHPRRPATTPFRPPNLVRKPHLLSDNVAGRGVPCDEDVVSGGGVLGKAAA